MNKIKFVVCLLFVWLIPVFAFAAGLYVTPEVVNVTIDCLVDGENEYKVKNTANSPVIVKISTTAWNTFSANNDKSDDWLKFEKYEYTVPANSAISVPYKINMSSGMVGSVSKRVCFSAQQDGASYSLTVLVPIYVTIRGTEIVDFDIQSVKIDKNTTTDKYYYSINMVNKGNVHVRPSGHIELFDDFDKLIDTITMEESVPLYTETDRIFYDSINSTNILPKCKYKAVFKIDALGKQATKELKFKVKKDGTIKVLK